MSLDAQTHDRSSSRARRRSIGLGLAVAALLLAFTAPATARQTETGGGEVVGGVPADNGEYPFVVSIDVDGAYLCGGSLLTPARVLTAAHCVDSSSPGGLLVRVGSNQFQSGGVVIPVSGIHVHRGWNPNTNDNDLAVLDLASPAALSSTVGTITVPRPNQGVGTAGTTVTVAGWGLTSDGGNVSPVLREASFPILANAACGAYGSDFHALTMLCAGVVAGGVDSCQGDSGGPLFADTPAGPAQVGVVSWGNGCAQPDFPGIYTRLSRYGANNDAFALAAPLPGFGGSAASRNYTAIREAGEPLHASNNDGGGSVWYRWTAPVGGRVTISTFGSNFDTLLGVYRGTSLTALTRIAANDDVGSRVQSRVTFTARRNTTYRIAVDGFEGDIGNVKVNLAYG